MGCCRIGPQRYKVFDADRSICCAGEIEPKTGNTISCCGRVAYDVKTHICCEMRVSNFFKELCCKSESIPLQAKNHCVKKFLYSEFFWSAFSRIWTEYGEIRSISPYSAEVPGNTEQKNSEYRNFCRSECSP